MTKREYTKKRNELKRQPMAQGLVRLLDYLWTHEKVTRIDGFTELGIANFPEAVRKLRKHGVPVEMEMVSGINRYGEAVRYGEYSITRRR